MQGDLTRHITIWAYKNSSRTLTPPLFSSLRHFGKKKRQEISLLISGWFLAEAALLLLEGDFGSYGKLLTLLKRSSLPQLSLGECLQHLEGFLVTFLSTNGKPCGASNFPLYKADKDFSSNALFVALKAVAYPDTRGVLESWGKAVEFYGDRDNSLAEFSQLNPKTLDYNLADYYVFLWEARDRIRASTVGELLLSYTTLCEIALSPPLLPFHSDIRGGGLTSRQLNPVQRMSDLLSVVGEVAPIRRLADDYVPFTDKVCAKLGWPTPLEVAASMQRNLVCPPGDKLFEFYGKAAELRCRIPYIFHDMSVWFLPEKDYTREFYYYFSHPVIQFSDKIGLHPDPSVFTFFCRAIHVSYIR